MKEQLITFETAKLAKERGFDDVRTNHLPYMLEGDDEGCIGASIYCKVYANCCTQSFLQKWLREVHNIDVFINRDGMFKKESYCIFIHDNIKDISRLRPLDNDVFSGYSTYEEALEVGLQEALKLV